ncbi:MAG: sodium-independent anion transporter [Anaerolineales bacterium]|nr:SulP family inorganic anion transporter [Anaerolineae bacterium]PWB54472.1 MAG: sodium-independent anion transporter [Anaerolineales bacterium]
MASQATRNKNRLSITRFLPIMSWLPNYQRIWLRGDVLAGLTVLALLIPEGMAYAEIAGMPPQTAFYAAPIGLLMYAIFGTSRQLVVAVSAAIATMSAAAIGPLAASGSPEYAALTAGLAILAGLVSIFAGLFKLGRIASFFSESVLAGFVTGLALTIAIKQVPKLFGLEGGAGNFWERLYEIIIHLNETHLLTLVVGLFSIALIFLLEHRFHKLPAALIVMVLGIILSSLFAFEALGIKVVGDIPAGLAPPILPSLALDQWLLLIPAALGLALVNFAEAYGPARNFSAKHSYEISANQELVGLGAANLGAGFFQGFSIGSSLSKSAANDRAGAKTPVALIVCAFLTIFVALFFTPLFAPLPEAVLAAVVVVAITGMIKVKAIRRLYHLNRMDFTLAIVAIFGVLTFEALQGLMIAVILSLLALVWRASQSKLSVLGREPGRLIFSDNRWHPDNHTIPGLMILRPDEGLFFANADALRNEIITLVDSAQPPVKVVLLDLEMSNQLDVPSMDMLVELHEELVNRNIDMWLSRLHGPVRRALERGNFFQKINLKNVRPRNLDSMLEYLTADIIDGFEDIEVVRDGLKMTQDVIEKLLTNPTEERREVLENYHQKLAEMLKATKLNSIK